MLTRKIDKDTILWLDGDKLVLSLCPEFDDEEE